MRSLSRPAAFSALIVGAVAASVGFGSPAPATSPPPTIVASAEQSGQGSGSDAAGSAGENAGSTGSDCVTFALSPFYSGVSASRAGELASHPLVSNLTGELAAAIAASPTGTATLYRYNCGGQTESSHWCPDGAACTAIPTVTVDDLVPDAYDEMRRGIPLPDPSLTAPPIEQGSLVNAPLWLAVSPPGPVTARAEAGAVWAQATGTFVGSTWDMGMAGTGEDVVGCVGPGTPWTPPAAGEDEFRPSPDCGWNYEFPSTPENTGAGEAYHVTVTAHWEVRITGSDGRDVAGEPIDVVSSFDYQVFEVQTVGSE